MNNTTTDLACINIFTLDDLRQFSLSLGVPGVVCLVLSVIGLVAELLFVCRKKNNFLLRLFVYLTIVITLSVAMYSLQLLLYADQTRRYYQVICEGTAAIHLYSTLVEMFLVCSISLILLYKVFTNICSVYPRVQRCVRRTGNISKTKWWILETIFLVIHFGLPLVITTTNILVVGDPVEWIPRVYCEVQFLENDCSLWRNSTRASYQYLIRGQILGNSTFVLSVISVFVLIFWLLWIWRKKMLRARFKTLLRDMTLLLTYLISYSLLYILAFIGLQEMANNSPGVTSKSVAYVTYPIGHIAVPIAFFVYLCASIRRGKSASSMSSAQKYEDRFSHIPTSPPSTRVSLPSDTAAHAPNFLSPMVEESTEWSPLIVNYPQS